MAAKSTKKKSGSKRSSSTVEELSAQVTALRSKVASLEDEAEAWKKKAEKQRSRAKKIAKQAERAIAKATGKGARKKRAGRTHEIAVDHVAVAARPYIDRPDETWTVARLRSMAREQGVTGYSRMPKDTLLASLTS